MIGAVSGAVGLRPVRGVLQARRRIDLRDRAARRRGDLRGCLDDALDVGADDLLSISREARDDVKVRLVLALEVSCSFALSLAPHLSIPSSWRSPTGDGLFDRDAVFLHVQPVLWEGRTVLAWHRSSIGRRGRAVLPSFAD
jgi:hypothetical protein